MFRFSQYSCLLLALLVPVVAPGAARASTWFLDTPAGANNNGEAVAANATITTGAGTVTISLNNVESTVYDIGQVLTGLSFTLSSGNGTGAVLSSSADVVKISSNGSITNLGTNPIFGAVTIEESQYSGWTLSTGLSLDLSVFGSGQPNFGVLNATQSSGWNNSITGNNPHNPFSRGTVTFVMSVASVTSATDVTSGIFQFGTNQNGGHVVSIADGLSPVPEPTSLVMWGLAGLAAIGYGGRSAGARYYSSQQMFARVNAMNSILNCLILLRRSW